ncbi:MAG: nitronate monooxygenase [Deltaproteobacteria bacterium]|nr:nitronate monooxygenase [Deltaproteobacteria bacterium]MBW2308340.1 nitronate monooxygenase [Deltaproteobacteria bacterium]
MSPKLKTCFTELAGVRFPIQCGAMQWLSRAPFVAAVANAGAFACLPAASFDSAEKLVEEIRKVRDLTDKPFGVNVSLFPAMRPISHEAMIDIVIEQGVKVIETAGRSPEPYLEKIRKAGLIHLHKCARVRDAVKVDRLGCHAVSIVGTECGGHPSMEMVTSLVLLPMTVDAVSIPVLAGGGFFDGGTLVAALAMGAAGVVMGTRFIATEECGAHPHIKERLIQATECDTVITQQSIRNPARVLHNRWAVKVLDMEAQGATLEELAPLINGQVSREAWETGAVEDALLHCGQVVGRIKNVLPVKELVQQIIAEAEAAIHRLEGLWA